MNYEEYTHDPMSERIVSILMKKNGNIHDALFYRVIVAFYLGKCASMMRCNVIKYDKQIIPVNIYALNLMPSGFGKGLSANLLEANILSEFRHNFLEETFPIKATENLTRLASKRAIKEGIDEEEALEKIGHEFTQLGQLMFSFDSGTPAALKQMRTKLLLGKAGSMNYHIDEIGSNLQKNQEMLEVFLELYDVGKVKQKLVKNTAENVRLEDMEGITPANLLMFGTPTKLLDGGRTEDLLMDFLETGFGRRCFFGLVEASSSKKDKKTLSPEEYLDNLLNSNLDTEMSDLSTWFGELASVSHFGKNLPMSRDVAIEVITYQQDCKKRSEAMPPYDDIGKAEMLHRYFKVIKLAGVYAFSSGLSVITMDNLHSAIKLAEESGEAFRRILSRDKNYVRLAKYIAHSGLELTQANLVEDLQFYKGTSAVKNEMLQLAIAWGYKHNIIIQKKYNEGIEFISGSALEDTNLDELIISHSNDAAYNYVPELVPFDRLHELTQINNYHFVNHHLKAGHRVGANAIRGFNTVILDIDGGCTIDTAKLLMKDYKYHLYTTKSHQLEGKGDRFRMVLPISHILKLSGNEYKEFMDNLFEWLPFDSDEQTGQRVCKWACNVGEYFSNDGELIDALQFIPATTKNEKRKESIKNLTNLNNLEKWFAMRMVEGQRSNEMIRFALMLVDSGMPIEDVEEKVMSLNSKLEEGLTETELASTVLRTAARRFMERG